MKLSTCLLWVAIFALIFSAILRLETELSDSGKSLEEVARQAYKINEEMRYKANFDFQLQSWFGKFREILNQKHDLFFVQKEEPEFLKKNLPAHTLAVAETDKEGKLLRFANLSGEMEPELVSLFIELADEFKVKFSDYNIKKDSAGKLARCDELLQQFLGIPTAKMNMVILRSSRASIFTSERRSTWFYWDRFQKTGDGELFFFSKLNLSDYSNLFSFRSFLKTNVKPGYYSCYYDYKNNLLISSRGFKEKVSREDAVLIGRECRKKQQLEGNALFASSTRLPLKNQMAIIGRLIGRSELRPVTVFDLPQNGRKSRSLIPELPAFALMCLVIVFLVNAAVFSRGPSLKVGIVLILSIIFAILMPFMMGRSVFKLILREAYEKERLKIERDVHQALTGVDSSFRMAQLNLMQRIGQSFKKPEILKKLQKEEEAPKDNEDLENSVILEIVAFAFKELARGFSMVPERYRTMNAIIIAGPDGFIRYFNKYRESEVFSRSTLDTVESMYLMLSLSKNQLFEYNPREIFDAEFYQQYLSEVNDKVEALKYEEVRSRLRASLGKSRFHEVLYGRGMMITLRTSFGQTLISNFPVALNGKYRYFASSVWDEYAICPTFLRRAFDLRLKADIAEIKSNEDSFFKKLDPAAYIDKKPIVFMAYDGFRFDSFSTLADEPQDLSILLKNTYRSKLLLKLETAGENASIFEVYPGKNITVYLSGAKQDISHLRKIENLRAKMFLAGMVIFILFALFAAKNISGSFTNPLQHLLWGLNQVQLNDYSVKLKDSREDEFGSISRAFNLMTRRLREKDALGKFVSESVKKLAADPELLRQACEGVEEEVTILFASLAGFSKMALESNDSEVQRHLEFSLSHFFRRAEEFGGEVDKVIGEKILIIFSNRKLGRQKAVESAIGLASRIKADFAANASLKPVFGINMGRVISGIIGAPSVRMDLTVIGDPVNVAARLCAIAEEQGTTLIVSGQIREVLKKKFKTVKIDVERVRGKRQEVEVFSLIV
jgi:class 3 adenylate cyclase